MWFDIVYIRSLVLLCEFKIIMLFGYVLIKIFYLYYGIRFNFKFDVRGMRCFLLMRFCYEFICFWLCDIGNMWKFYKKYKVIMFELVLVYWVCRLYWFVFRNYNFCGSFDKFVVKYIWKCKGKECFIFNWLEIKMFYICSILFSC